jgi:hypothetical protein
MLVIVRAFRYNGEEFRTAKELASEEEIMGDSFTCDVCKRSYDIDKLRGVATYINRPSNSEMRHITCIYCAAERENAEFDAKLANSKWDDLSDAHPRIFNRFDGRDVLGREIFKPAHVAGGVGVGWLTIVSEASDKIEEELNKFPNPAFLHFANMKEKFSQLRWDSSAPSDAIMDIIDEAERRSGSICEACGQPGTQTNDGGWILTLCPEHMKEKNRQ